MSEDDLLGWVEGELSELDQARFEEQLEAPALVEAEGLRAVVELFREAEDEPAPRELRGSILAALEAEFEPEEPWWTHLVRYLKTAPVMAGAALLFFGFTSGFLGWGPEPAPPPGARPGVTLAGVELDTGSPLTVAAGDTAILQWRGCGPVELRGPAQVVLRAWSIELNEGTLISEVDPPDTWGFRVLTPDAEVAVVGTRFQVIYRREQGTAVQVFEGEVRVEDLRRHLVRTLTPEQRAEWQMWHIEGDEPPPPTSAPEPEPTAPEPTVPAEPARLPGDPLPNATPDPENNESEPPAPAATPAPSPAPTPAVPEDPPEEEDLPPDPADQPASTVDEGF